MVVICTAYQGLNTFGLLLDFDAGCLTVFRKGDEMELNDWPQLWNYGYNPRDPTPWDSSAGGGSGWDSESEDGSGSSSGSGSGSGSGVTRLGVAAAGLTGELCWVLGLQQDEHEQAVIVSKSPPVLTSHMHEQSQQATEIQALQA